jgi:hypothetical protein
VTHGKVMVVNRTHPHIHFMKTHDTTIDFFVFLSHK